MAAEVARAAFPEVVVDRKWLSNRQGRDFILYAGLVDALHQLSWGGNFAIETRIEQLPSAENGQTAVCSAVVRVFDPVDPDVMRKMASGIGDADPGNVSKMMTTALIRMAETRAKARALRDLCNIAMVAVEELGQDGAEAPANERTPAAAEKAPVRASSAAPRPVAAPSAPAAYYERYASLQAEAAALGLSTEPLPPGLTQEEATDRGLALKARVVARRTERELLAAARTERWRLST